MKLQIGNKRVKIKFAICPKIVTSKGVNKLIWLKWYKSYQEYYCKPTLVGELIMPITKWREIKAVLRS